MVVESVGAVVELVKVEVALEVVVELAGVVVGLVKVVVELTGVGLGVALGVALEVWKTARKTDATKTIKTTTAMPQMTNAVLSSSFRLQAGESRGCIAWLTHAGVNRVTRL